jgi:hypothetical protein
MVLMGLSPDVRDGCLGGQSPGMDLVFEGNPGCTTISRVRDGDGVQNANCGALRAMVGSVEAVVRSG